MNLPQRELEVLEWWQKERIFERSVEKNTPEEGPPPPGRGRDFVFYEGPPTANGMPGIHHVLSRAFKDIIPRFKTMQGYRVVRKGGWDTHGLPVELEVEKELGLKSKKEVEEYGMEQFNAKCRASVWKYKEQWERFTARMGYWLDLEHAYITYEGSYVNALWGVIKKIWERGLLVEGHKVVPHCPRCGTALSSHEVAQGYQTVKDLSLTVKFKIQNPKSKMKESGDIFIVSWTTTPWTLPGNVALAVGANIDYVVVKVVPPRHPDPAVAGEGSRPQAAFDASLDSSLHSVPLRMTMRGDRMFEYIILAKERLSVIEDEYEVIKELKGSELVGLEYEPLFDIPALKSSKSYKVYAADFVSTAEGTGIVHTAVMYGEDDYRLGTEVGLPKLHTVNEDGTFVQLKTQNSKLKTEESGDNFFERLAGRFVKDQETERMIIEYLEGKRLVFKKELYEHDYPFCWRCKTPLLYYAKHSWFVAMSKLRNELIKANNQINWVPSYIKEGRFGEWLREVKDWAFSRERYWGTPLPIWKCQVGEVRSKKLEVRDNNNPASSFQLPASQQGCGRVEVIGSVAELVQKSKLKNRYIFMRHGEAESNVKKVDNTVLEDSAQYPLTEKGKQQAQDAAQRLSGERVEKVFTSDFARAKETAEILGSILHASIQLEPRLREINIPAINGKPTDPQAQAHQQNVTDIPHGGESLGKALARMASFVQDVEEKDHSKTYVVVSHGDPLWVLQWAMAGSPGEIKDSPYPKNADPTIVDHGVFLTTEQGELDLHRPRVDEVEWRCECGGVMRRVPEVADVWFDSGAMPFAQYPQNVQALTNADGTQTDADNVSVSPREVPRESALVQFPADYISEAIDQTRGWFYTLLAVSVALGKGTPYKNVICLGHVLDAKGKKMSKSLGNIVQPSEMFEKYGADAVRWYLFTMNDPGLPKRFNEKEIHEVVKKFFMILWNVVSFHELYPPASETSPTPPSQGGDNRVSPPYPLRRTRFAKAIARRGFSEASEGGARGGHVLDRWILARLNQLIKFVSERLDAYDVTPAARAIQEFVTDLSTWYVRRSRERMKSGDEEARRTLKFALVELAKLIAPFAPFTAEALWQRLGQEGSVHLAEWPKAMEVDAEALTAMDMARKIVEAGLAARATAKMPIRQPLGIARIKNVAMSMHDEYIEILNDELNVKEVVIEKGNGVIAVELDTTLTEELKLEGMKRELARAVNNLRKEAKLTIQDTIMWELQKTPATEKLLGAYGDELHRATLASDIRFTDVTRVSHKGSVRLGEVEVKFGF